MRNKDYTLYRSEVTQNFPFIKDPFYVMVATDDTTKLDILTGNQKLCWEEDYPGILETIYEEVSGTAALLAEYRKRVLKEPNTVFCVFSDCIFELNPWNTETIKTNQGNLFIEVTEWGRDCNCKDCKKEILPKTVCFRLESHDKTSHKKYICSNCALKITKLLRYQSLSNFLKASFFTSSLLEHTSHEFLWELENNKHQKDGTNE